MDTAVHDKISVYYLSGNPGTGTASRIRSELLALFDVSKKIVINLGKLETVDVSIIQILIAAFAEAESRSIDMRLSGDTAPRILEDFKICGLSKSAPAGTRQLEQLLRSGNGSVARKVQHVHG